MGGRRKMKSSIRWEDGREWREKRWRRQKEGWRRKMTPAKRHKSGGLAMMKGVRSPGRGDRKRTVTVTVPRLGARKQPRLSRRFGLVAVLCCAVLCCGGAGEEL
jgi:hypothetical protein